MTIYGVTLNRAYSFFLLVGGRVDGVQNLKKSTKNNTDP